MARVLEYYDIPMIKDDRTVHSLLTNLDIAGISYDIIPYHDNIDASHKGFLLFDFTTSWHVGVIEDGVYKDSYNHFEYGMPKYIVSMGLLPSKT
jgi:hypothetical protein